MTLDEAIKHCEEVAEEQDMKAGFETDYQTYTMSEEERERCKECAAEHRQLAEWLKKLLAYEEAEEEINRKMCSGQWSEAVVFGMSRALLIMRRHIKEVNADDTNRCED